MASEQTTSTSLAELRRPPVDTQAAAVVMGFESAAGFDLMQRGAKLLAASTLVPKDYQNNLPNCVIALNMAARLKADPLLVMQSLYLVHGRPSWSSQFLIATINQSGRFSALRYKWTGTEGKDDWSCQAYAKEFETGETIYGPTISIALAKKEGWYDRSGSKWKTMPQLMLMYRAAAWLVRTHAPELSMGLQTAEEAGDIIETEQDHTGRYRVTQEELRKVHSLPPSDDKPLPVQEQATTPAANGTVTQEQAPAAKEFIDEATAKKWMKDATSADHLEKLWATIMTQLDPDKEIPAPIEAYYHFRKEALAKVPQ